MPTMTEQEVEETMAFIDSLDVWELAALFPEMVENPEMLVALSNASTRPSSPR